MIPRMAPEIAAMVAEYTAGTPDPRSPSVARHPSQVDGDSPAEWMRAHFNWPRELTEDQMEYIGELGNGDQEWRRPGSANHHSLTLHPSGAATVWSDNCPAWMHRYSWPQRGGAQTINAFTYYAGKYHGGDLAAASAHIRREFMPPPPRMLKMPNDAPEADDGFENDSWFKPVDLTSYLDGTHVEVEPTILRRSDGVSLFYPGMLNGIHGESGLGKGWVALTAVVEVARAGGQAIYVDLEDTPQSIANRLRTLGLTMEQIGGHVTYVRPTDPTSDRELAGLRHLCQERQASLVVIDSLGEAFGLDGINENNDNEVTPWLRKVGRVLADTGACVIVVDHVTKAMENPLYAKGSARKRATMGGASFLVEVLSPLTKGKGGKLRLTCAKDRHGTHTRGQVSAEIAFRPSGEHDMLVSVFAPAGADGQPSADEMRQQRIIDAALALERIGRTRRKPFSKTSLCDSLTDVRAEIKRAGFEMALNQGRIVEVGRNLYKVQGP